MSEFSAKLRVNGLAIGGEVGALLVEAADHTLGLEQELRVCTADKEAAQWAADNHPAGIEQRPAFMDHSDLLRRLNDIEYTDADVTETILDAIEALSALVSDVILGDGKTLVSDVAWPEQKSAGIVFSEGGEGVGVTSSKKVSEDDLKGVFLRIISDNPKSLRVVRGQMAGATKPGR